MFCWGIPFDIGRPIRLLDKAVTGRIEPVKAQWLIFMHTADFPPLEWNRHGFLTPSAGRGRLAERMAEYVIVYGDCGESRHEIRRRHQIGLYRAFRGENCSQAVAPRKSDPIASSHEMPTPSPGMDHPWGLGETRNRPADSGP